MCPSTLSRHFLLSEEFESSLVLRPFIVPTGMPREGMAAVAMAAVARAAMAMTAALRAAVIQAGSVRPSAAQLPV